MMLLQWPVLFIHDVTTADAVVCPAAMFSPADVHVYPALLMRVVNVDPLDPVWLKKYTVERFLKKPADVKKS